jgi:DUF3035 family protein
MRIARGAALVALVAMTGLAGCANKGLRNITADGPGPDEFMVSPVKPLSQPDNYQILPAPTPGGSNLVDTNPRADAVVALGGRASALDPNGNIPGSDGALVTASSRYGVSPDVRLSLAEQDAAFRKKKSRLSGFRLFQTDRYNKAYSREALNPFAETVRFLNAGVMTPTAPPADQ